MSLTDFAVNRTSGTVTRLKPFDRTLYTFICEYDDQADVIAGIAAAETADKDEIAAGLAKLREYAVLPSPTNAQTVACVKLLCRAMVLVAKRLMQIE